MGFHLFGTIAADPVTPAGATFFSKTKFIYLTRDRCRFRCGVVRIAIAGPEFQRCGENLTPLPTTIFSNPFLGLPGAGLPAGASFSPRSQIKVVVGFSDDTLCPRKLCFDVGQTIEIVAECCDSVALLVPENFTIVGNSMPTAEGLVVDAFIKAGIWEVESPIGALGGHCTDNLHVPVSVSRCVPVPDGAQEVQIFQSSAGVAAGSFRMLYGDPTIVTCPQEHGVISFEPGLRQTPIKRVGNTTHLCSDIDNLTARFFTLVWRIES